MVILALGLLGLCFGSFVNALVYRLHEQDKVRTKKTGNRQQTTDNKLSIMHGRSMCVHCKHILSWQDLIPVVSWLMLRGKCRYCRSPIAWQYPLVELATAALFILSYLSWPILSKGNPWQPEDIVQFGFWIVFLTGFMALAVYDLKWFLLPNRVVFPLLWVAAAKVAIHTAVGGGMEVIPAALLGAAIGGGIFYVLFQLSDGKWIGGGDVKLGLLIGLVLGNPLHSLLMIFTASLAGSLVTVPLLLGGKTVRGRHIPFGPFLILATVIVRLYGQGIINWYQALVLPLP